MSTKPLNLNYFYDKQAEQFNFYRIPKTLLSDWHYQSLSIEAMLLYSLMLDRVGLSIQNGWVDEKRRVYIYFTQEEAMSAMRCGKDKITKLFRELDQNGIGLIERHKQGLGHPARIYVKDFTPPMEPDPSTPDKAPNDGPHGTENQQSEGGISEALTTAEPRFGPLETSSQDGDFCAAIKTNKNNTDFINTELSIYPPTPLPHRQRPASGKRNRMDAYRAIIRENISYDLLVRDYGMDPDLIDGYVELMAEICGSSRETVHINQDDLPTEEVRNRFLTLDMTHIAYVMDCLSQNTSRVTNIRAYMLSALYNAPATMSQYYVEQVSHDIAQRRREAGA